MQWTSYNAEARLTPATEADTKDLFKPEFSIRYSQNRFSSNDNRLMIYFQGMKVYIPDNFQPDTLLKLLQTLKKL